MVSIDHSGFREIGNGWDGRKENEDDDDDDDYQCCLNGIKETVKNHSHRKTAPA